MEKQKILIELNELLNIPQFERLLAHKIEELKDIYQGEIELYSKLQKNFRQNAYGKMSVCEEDGTEATKVSQTYRFELNRGKGNEWKPGEIEPAIPIGGHYEDIIPPLIIDFMTAFQTSATKIETVNHFSHPKLKGKTYNLRFAKYSEYHLLGTITEVLLPKQDTAPASQLKGEADNLIYINDFYKNKNDELNYMELIYYLEKYPSFRAHTLSEFFMKWKPLIDGGLLKIT